MLYFLDTSALVKRYRRETGTEVLEQLFTNAASLLVISAFSLLEFTRTMDRHRQTGELSEGDVRLATEQLASDCHTQRVGVVDVSRGQLVRAKDLILAFHLSAPDALILATALTLAEESPIFVCADTRSGLLRAAEVHRLSTLNPLSP